MRFLGLHGRALREALWGYALIAPTLLLIAIFSYLSLGASLVLSFMNWEG